MIGFSVYTTKRQSVFRYFLRHQPIRVLGNLIQLIGRNPRTLVAMVSNFRYLLSEELPWEGEVSGWWLVAGVRPEYRTREFEGRTGIRVAAQLFDQMEEVMQRDGCPAWYGVVRPDNTAINLFLQRRGAQLVANAQAQGMEMSYYVKILRS